MARDPRDREDGPFDDMFRLMEQFMKEMTESMDRMMGPYGHVDIDMSHDVATPDRGHRRHTSETHVDVEADGDEVRVVADLPGVTKEAIDVTCDGRALSITATGDRREYNERIRLPTRVDEQSATATYNNGILEVTLELADSDDSETAIDIE